MGLQGVLDAAREEERARELERQEQQRQRQLEENRKNRLALENLLPKLRPASVQDYLKWLKGYFENGGKPSHVYDYPFSRWPWHVAIANIEPIALCGSSATNIIIPTGILAGDGDWGHCNLFFMDGYRKTGIVPVFSDTNFD